MFDIRLLRDDPEAVRQRLSTRHCPVDLDEVLRLDAARRDAVTKADKLKTERNAASKGIGMRKKAGEDTAPAQERVRAIGEEIASLDLLRRDIEEKLRTLVLAIPNLPQEDVPVGEDESANVVVGTWAYPLPVVCSPMISAQSYSWSAAAKNSAAR